MDIAFDDAGRPRSVPLACGPGARSRCRSGGPSRWPALARVWYVDLTRATEVQIAPTLPRRRDRPRGVVFDMRGYPTDAGAEILPHLLNGAGAGSMDARPASIAGPFGRVGGWFDIGWNMGLKAPAIDRPLRVPDRRPRHQLRRVGDGLRRGSEARHDRGRPTAGTNGNVVSFDVPGGCQIAFTGMRVTRRRRNHPPSPDRDRAGRPAQTDDRRDPSRSRRALEKAVALIDRPPSPVPPTK